MSYTSQHVHDNYSDTWERQDKDIQIKSQDSNLSKKNCYLGWDPNPWPSAFQAKALLTALPVYTKAAQLAEFKSPTRQHTCVYVHVMYTYTCIHAYMYSIYIVYTCAWYATLPNALKGIVINRILKCMPSPLSISMDSWVTPSYTCIYIHTWTLCKVCDSPSKD